MPYVSVYYSMERTYFQVMVVLAPYLVVCGTLIGRLLKIRPYLILLPVLIPFFMSVTGTVYNLFGIPASVLINSEGTEYEHLYVQDRESYAAKWLAKNMTGGRIHTDYDLGPRILASQGRIPSSRVIGSVIADYRHGKEINGYLYLFYPAVIKGDAAMPAYAHMDIIAAPELLFSRNKAYSAGDTEIYWSR